MNLITNLTGVDMFILSSAISASSLALAKAATIMDDSMAFPAPQIEGTEAVLLTALLRDGKNGVLQVILYDLWKRQIIQIQGEGRYTLVKSNHNSLVQLDELEQKIVQYVEIPRKPHELFKSTVLSEGVEKCIGHLREKLEELHLWNGQSDRQRIAKIRTVSYIALLGLGIIQMLTSPLLNNAFWPEVFVTALSLPISYGLLAEESKSTLLGRKYIAVLSKDRMKEEKMPDFDRLPHEDELMHIAIFGMPILENSIQNAVVYNAFRKT